MAEALAPRRGMLTPGGWDWTWPAVALPVVCLPLAVWPDGWVYAVYWAAFNLLACRAVHALAGLRRAVPVVLLLLGANSVLGVLVFPQMSDAHRGRETAFADLTRPVIEQKPQP
jgi:hypothetical protein